MATPAVSDNPAVQQHYAAQLALSAALTGAVKNLWEASDPLASRRALRTFREAWAAVVEQFSHAASSWAVDYYAEARRLAGVPGSAKVDPVPSPPQSLVKASLDWSLTDADAAMADIRERLEADALEIEAALLKRAQAAAQKAVMDVSRGQVVAAVEGDEKAIGFRRVARPDACAWCLILAFRSSTRTTRLSGDREKFVYGGPKHYGVYKSRESAGQLPAGASGQVNRYHNNCHCAIEPVFSPVEELPAWLASYEQLYEDADGGLNGFRRAVNAKRSSKEPPSPVAPAVLMPARAPQEQIAALLDQLSKLAA